MQRQSSSHVVETRQERSDGNSSSGRALCRGVLSLLLREVSASCGRPCSST
jgi:hypothetical protein